jgi:3-carboxy-cis,cis-muconate cycloisomerase
VSLALGAHIGRPAAYAVVEKASRQAVADGHHLREVLAGDASVTGLLDAVALDQLFDPRNYLGSSAAFIDRARGAHFKEN